VRSPPQDGSLGAALPLIADVLKHVVQVVSRLHADTSAWHAAAVLLPATVGPAVAVPPLASAVGATVTPAAEGATLPPVSADGAGVLTAVPLGETVPVAPLGATLPVATVGARDTVGALGATLPVVRDGDSVDGSAAGAGAGVVPVTGGAVAVIGRASNTQLSSPKEFCR
jgi:hypothetical protein